MLTHSALHGLYFHCQCPTAHIARSKPSILSSAQATSTLLKMSIYTLQSAGLCAPPPLPLSSHADATGGPVHNTNHGRDVHIA